MASTQVVYYCEGREAPALEWLLDQPTKVRDKFEFLIELLEEKGSLLSRPYAAPLADKIYELRARHMQVNYRLLYFFAERSVVVLAHGCTKESAVDPADIRRASQRREKFMKAPRSHTYVLQA